MTRRDVPGTAFDLAAVTNLGPKSAALLARIGVTRLDELLRRGAVEVYDEANSIDPRVSLNLLWTLEGAILGQPWQQVARGHRTRLLLALDDHQRRAVPASRRRLAQARTASVTSKDIQ